MRLHYIVLLAALLAGVDAISAATDFKMTTPSTPLDQNEVSTQRLLRDEGESDEERAISLPSVESVSNWLKSLTGSTVTQAQLDGWLLSGKSADEVFDLLKLNKAGANLFEHPELSAWVTYMKAFNMKNPGQETTMLKSFTAAYGDAALAKMIEAAKAVPSTKQMAQDLQAAQFKHWLTDGIKPQKLFDDIFKLQLNTWKSDPAAIILHQYNQFYKSYL